MMFMNEYEIEASVQRFMNDPVLSKATRFLQAYMREVNSHSDGWPYWRPPVQAAKRLMMLIQEGREGLATESALAWALQPIKSFMTRRGNAAGMKLPEVQS